MSKFKYPEISTVEYNKQRWYSVNEETVYPSITTILGFTMPEEKKKGLENWRTMLGPIVADKKMKDACSRGTNVHLMLEQFLKGEEVKLIGVPPEDIQVYNSVKLRLKGITEIYGQEMPLWSEVLQVAGRCDLVGKWKDEEAIIDFKTSGRSKNEKDIQDYWLQCAFYAMAHNELYGTNIEKGVIIMGVANGFPLVFEKDLIPYVGQLMERIEKFYNSL
jgi:ATP-dependent exoDNAse (exonuclease V) beta subunit